MCRCSPYASLSLSSTPNRDAAMTGTATATDNASLTLAEKVRIYGSVAEATLASDGTLRWSSGNGGECCLTFDNEVLGLEAAGVRITIRAFVEAHKSLAFCGGEGGLGRRVRRDYVLEMPTEEAASMWMDKMRAYLDSLGKCVTSVNWHCCEESVFPPLSDSEVIFFFTNIYLYIRDNT